MMTSRIPARVLRRVVAAVAVACVPALTPQTIAAQSPDVRGVVRDSATGAPVPGVVVLALDALGATLSRAITNERGTYRVNRPDATMLIRAVRLGYRPTTERLPTLRAPSMTLDLSIVTIPRALEAVGVTAARGCPVRTDRAEAYALLDQARAGLLAAVVARERQPAELKILRFERYLDLDGIETERQYVRIDSSRNAKTSFNAVQSAVDFVNRGFRTGPVGQYTFLGPDADVLLDERFQRGYCFSVASSDTARRTQVGLRFTPADRRDGRVDIDGTLWIDTAARALTDIQFTYLGVEALAESFGAGGRVSFRTLPNGSPLIDRWALRLVGAPDTLVTDAGTSTQMYAVREIGGELVRARWADGQSWTGPLGSVHITAVDSKGAPAPRATINLLGTDYRTTTDAVGRATIELVLPGPYQVVIDDEKLRAVDLPVPTAKSLVVQRSSSALLRLTVPTAEEFISTRCSREASRPTDAWLLARVYGADGRPAAGAHWRVSELRDGRWRVVSDNGITGSDGIVALCRGIEKGATVEVAAWRDPKDAVKVRKVLEAQLSVARIALPVVAVVAARPAVAGPTLTVSGTVRDSTTNAPVADARVTFLGTPFEGAADSTGVFVVGGLSSGDFVVEVSTPWLDSIGAVHRVPVLLSEKATALSLYLPSLNAALSAACGSAEAGAAVVGTVSSRFPTPMPAGLRVVAEWIDTTRASDGTARSARLAWARAAVESSGTYRLCGVPAGSRVALRTEADTATILGSLPLDVTVSLARRFARADLVLDSAVVSYAAFTGTVIADTTGVPVENAEVSLTDIGKSVLTDRRGAFRVSEIPLGTHLVAIKRVGFAPIYTSIDFEANRAVDQRLLMNKAQTLATVSTIAALGEGAPADFEERRKSGIGRFLAREDLDKHRGRRLGDVITQVSGFGSASSSAGRAWVIGKRPPQRSLPRSGGVDAQGTAIGCGSPKPTRPGEPGPCTFSMDDLRNQGFYCPTTSEQSQGILSCACFSQVYLDDRLMNPGKPTEPFDANTLPVEDIAGVEFYATGASTPGRYSQLNAVCGVMLVWTRRR